MTAQITTDWGSPVPDEFMPKWCENFADGDKRLRVEEVSLNVFRRRLTRTPGQLWERVTEHLIRCDYCGDRLPGVASRAHIPTTPDLQRLGFAADKVVCPECVTSHTNGSQA